MTRYRHLSYRHTVVVQGGQAWPFAEIWQLDRLRLLAQAGWRPEADMSETATTVDIVVDLAGVGDEDFEVQLFEDALVVEGHRLLTGSPQGSRYHIAGIRQGPFRVELPLPAPVDAERVDLRYERGLLRITLAKRGQVP